MFRGGIPIGRAWGIALRLHYSWFFIFALITWALAGVYFPSAYPDWSLSLKIGAGLLTSFLFFGSVLFHELCHSLIALREGIQIQSITLFFLGGVSQMTEEPKTAGDEFRMAAAGPFSSLVLGGVFIGIFFALRDSADLAAQFGAAVTYYLGFINILLGVFNLIPGFPLDGGRVFRSIVWWRNKNLKSATKIASNVGRGFGFLFILGGVYLIFFTGNFFNGIWLALIGWFLESAAAGSYRQLLLQEMLKGHTAAEIMTRDCQTVPPDMSLDRLVEEKILSTGRRCYPVIAGEDVAGLITMANVRDVPRDRWNYTQVKEAMTPINQTKSVGPDTDLNSVFEILTRYNINQVPVIYDKKILGIVGRDNLINFINTHSEMARS